MGPALPNAESRIPEETRGRSAEQLPQAAAGRTAGGNGGTAGALCGGAGGPVCRCAPHTMSREGTRLTASPAPAHLALHQRSTQAQHPEASAMLTLSVAALATRSSPSPREAQTQTGPGAGQQDLALQFY